jgi:hypothetical protein
MKLTFLNEPELEFGTARHVDIRFGIMQYHPFDINEERRPSTIRIGVVGTSQSIGGVTDWLEALREEVAAYESPKPNLYPKFPGFSEDSPFQSRLIVDPALNSAVHHREIFPLKVERDYNKRMKLAAQLFADHIGSVAEKSVDLVVCAMPSELIDILADVDPSEEETEEEHATPEESEAKFAFHDLLKARCMRFGKPIQVIRPSTYDESQKRHEKDEHGRGRRLQDPATRAWNLMTAIYYKAGGIPWRKPRSESEFVSCFIGVSFFHTLDRKSVQTSIAQVFNERGYGFMVRGAEVKITKHDRQPRLDAEGMKSLIEDALQRYRQDHQHLPARVVIHKSSRFSDAEIEGAEAALGTAKIEIQDFLSLAPSFLRLYRQGYYPPLRGTVLEADDTQHFLYSRGSVNFYEEYPGMYVPRSLQVRYDRIASPRRDLLREVLLLTKMNWNNTQLDSSSPITLRAARQVGTILRYLGKDDPLQHPYKFYM